MWHKMDYYIALLLTIGLLSQGICTLRMTRVSIPAYKFRGEHAQLECRFDLNDGDRFNDNRPFVGGGHEANDDGPEHLYSVKWYKDNEEFYRFVPKANPPQQSFKVDGIRVDHSQSNSKMVMLRNLVIRSSGLYRCEVSAEAPSFASVQGEGRMEIVFLPKDGPNIIGEEKQYQVGDILYLNCTSGKSHPGSVLHWYINDEPVIDPNNLIQYREVQHSHGMITTSLGLHIFVDGHHFHNGVMRVKCVGNLSPVLWQGGRESVVQRRPALIDNREAMFLVRGTGTRTECSRSFNLVILVMTTLNLLSCNFYIL